MKVMIIGYSNKDSWYKDKIGKIFSVSTYNDKNFTVREKGMVRKLILKKDCEVIEK